MSFGLDYEPMPESTVGKAAGVNSQGRLLARSPAWGISASTKLPALDHPVIIHCLTNLHDILRVKFEINFCHVNTQR